MADYGAFKLGLAILQIRRVILEVPTFENGEKGDCCS